MYGNLVTMSDSDSDTENLILSNDSTSTEVDEDSSDDGETTVDFGSAATDNSSAEFTRVYGNITVTVVKDDIADQQVDVIINSTGKTLDLKEGAASKKILKKGGNCIQQECHDKYSNGISEGDIAMTTGGSLQCKQVYHTCIPSWNSGSNKMFPQKVLLKCLQEASKSNHTSLASTALGTGYLNHNKDFVAKTLFAGVEKFSMNNPNSSVTDVKFVIYPSDLATLLAFTNAGNKKKGADTSARQVCSVKLRNVDVYVKVGQLHEQQSEVVMTTSTRGLDLKRGTLSNSVAEAAGPALQAECASKYPKGIQHGEIAVLGPANIGCKNIYCGALPRHDKPQDGADPKQLLTKLVTVCLQRASDDGMKSVSFPTLGTGYLMFPPKVAANLMLKAVSDFATKKANSTVKTVNIVILSLTSTVQKNLQSFKLECESFKPSPPPVAPKPKQPKLGVFVLPGLKSQPRRVRRSPESSTELASDILPERGTPEFCINMYANEIIPPPYWTEFTSNNTVKQWKVKQKGKQLFKLVTVDPNTYTAIEQLVQRTWEPAKLGHGRDAEGLSDLDFKSLKVTKIERLENLTLYEQYCQHRQDMFHSAGEGEIFTNLADIPNIELGCSNVEKYLDSAWKDRLYHEINENYLFHGTKKDLVPALLSQGIDPRLAQGGAVLGSAVYMAESSTKADQYTDPRDNRQKTGLQMFLIRASLGKICVMNDVKKLRRPPCCEGCDNDTCTHEKRNDSVVSEGKFIFREFVVYDRNQVYPEYVISYDRV